MAAPPAFGAYVGSALDKDVGVIVLTNVTNVGFPDAVGDWMFDRLLGNPEVDHVAAKLAAAKAGAAAGDALFARPANPRPSPPLAPLAGSFANPAFGKVTVRQDGDALVVEIVATGAGSASRHGTARSSSLAWSPRDKTPTWRPTRPVAARLREFQTGPDGKVALFRLRLQALPDQTYDFTLR